MTTNSEKYQKYREYIKQLAEKSPKHRELVLYEPRLKSEKRSKSEGEGLEDNGKKSFDIIRPTKEYRTKIRRSSSFDQASILKEQQSPSIQLNPPILSHTFSSANLYQNTKKHHIKGKQKSEKIHNPFNIHPKKTTHFKEIVRNWVRKSLDS